MARIEGLIQQEVGRHASALFAASSGGLLGAAAALAQAEAPSVAIITGFYVPSGTPRAAETDGPVGAALLARGLHRLGIPCRLATDQPCRDACAAALAGAGLDGLATDVVEPGDALDALGSAWRQDGISHVVAIERCGRSADGAPRNMRGADIGAVTATMDDLFLGGPWVRIAIGDGGNEIGMGSLPRGLIAGHVPLGEAIACVTPADHLIVAGVSNWGAWGLMAALAVLRADWREALLADLDPALDHAILRATVWDGPAVDGVTRRQEMTVDGIDAAVHHAKLREIRAAAQEVAAPSVLAGGA